MTSIEVHSDDMGEFGFLTCGECHLKVNNPPPAVCPACGASLEQLKTRESEEK